MSSSTVERPPSRQPNNYNQHRQGASSDRFKFMAAGAVLLIAGITIAVVAMQGSSVYYVTLEEFMTKQSTLNAAEKEIRVAGKVLPGTIQPSINGKGVQFTAMDKNNPSLTMKVVYPKLPPDTFKDEAEVVVTGTYNNNVFTASDMLAKCPSKYSSTAENSN